MRWCCEKIRRQGWVALFWVSGICWAVLALAEAHPQAKPTAERPGEHAGLGAQKANAGAAVQESLKKSVIESLNRLGTLQPWQKKLFQEDVIPQYQRFVRDYRMQDSQIQADIDLEGLRNFLAFHANPTPQTPVGASSAKPEAQAKDTRLGLLVSADVECEKCVAVAPKARALATAILERRGFMPVVIRPEELGELGASSRGLEERLAAVALAKGLMGGMILQFKLAPIDNIDTAHADEKEFLVDAILTLPAQARQTGNLRVLDSEPLDGSVTRLMTDVFTRLGARVIAQSGAPANADEARSELALSVGGIKTFHQFAQLKMLLQVKLKEFGLVEERRMTRSQVVFGIRTTRNPAELRVALSDFNMDQARLKVLPGESVRPNRIDAGMADDKVVYAEVE